METDFNVFLSRFSKRIHNIFHVETDINELSLERGLPKAVWSKIMELRPLSVVIPKEYGGRGGHVKECISTLSAASYESLPLSLTFGINMALFLEPLTKYGHTDVQKRIFSKFLDEEMMGGLMLTEPDFGSDALNMTTSYEQNKGNYHIKGKKHWQGLTGMADFWLVVARKKINSEKLSRDVAFFVTENAHAAQKINVDEYFNNPGLYMISYGLNNIDISVPKTHKLEPESTGIKMMLDVLHRSRIQFPGMGMGFIKRMLDEALHHCTHRKVAGKRLSELDSVQYQLSRIQAAYTLCSGMCAHSAAVSGIEHDLSGIGVEANSIKALVTDLMSEAADICAQLAGASGYKIQHIAGRGIMDSRPFQIFEGSNEMLYTQIAESIEKQMKKIKISNLYEFMANSKYCGPAIKRFKKHLHFKLPTDMIQRQMVTLGKVIARLVCLQYVADIVEKGYRMDMYENCIKHIEMDVKKLLSNLREFNDAQPIMNYADQSDWRDFA